MKKMKRVMALVLAVVLAMGMSMTVFATGEGLGDGATTTTYQISVPEGDDHTYAVYQIFTGDWSDSGVLSNIKWGTNAKPPTGVKVGDKVDATILSGLESQTTDKDVLAYLDNYVDLKTAAVATVSKNNPASVPGGYYLIKDNSTITGDDAATLYIVQVVGKTEIKRKADKPTVEKKVKENTKVTDDTYGAGYNDVADYSIGDTVPFELIGKVSSEYDSYTKGYYYSFEDTLSTGLTYKEGTLHVYKATWTNDKLILGDEITSFFNVNASGQNVKVTTADLKAAVSTYYDGMRIVVQYDAVLNSGAVVGNAGNKNAVKLIFSNNPNSGGDGDRGTTPEDEVIVFTYELDTTKIDGGTNDGLKGAEFKLKNAAGKWLQVDTNGKVSGWVDNENNASTLISGEDGLFKVIGLDDGTYFLKETKAPDKYNILDKEITLVIKSDTANGQEVADLSAALKAVSVKPDDKEELVGNATTGIVGIGVENNKGSTLPETGGIGTTIFYVLGGILVVGCGVILITRKRVGGSK